MERTTPKKASLWPRYNWILIALQLLSAGVVLVCLGWYGLKDRSGLPVDFMCWLPGVAAGFTLLHAAVGLSASNLSVCEVLIGDMVALGFWIAVMCKMGLFIAGAGSPSSCASFPEGAGRNSCAASQIVLVLAVDLSVLSVARMMVAFFVRRRKPSPVDDLDDGDSEGLCNTSE